MSFPSPGDMVSVLAYNYNQSSRFVLTLNLDEFLLAAPPGVDGLDWLVESDKGVFNDFASRLAVDRFDRGVTLPGMDSHSMTLH